MPRKRESEKNRTSIYATVLPEQKADLLLLADHMGFADGKTGLTRLCRSIIVDHLRDNRELIERLRCLERV